MRMKCVAVANITTLCVSIAVSAQRIFISENLANASAPVGCRGSGSDWAWGDDSVAVYRHCLQILTDDVIATVKNLAQFTS